MSHHLKLLFVSPSCSCSRINIDFLNLSIMSISLSSKLLMIWQLTLFSLSAFLYFKHSYDISYVYILRRWSPQLLCVKLFLAKESQIRVKVMSRNYCDSLFIDHRYTFLFIRSSGRQTAIPLFIDKI